MVLYYLNLYNGSGLTLDEEGQDFRDSEEARASAVQGIRSILAAELESGTLDLNGRLEVLDQNHALVLTIAFSDAVDVTPAKQSAQ